MAHWFKDRNIQLLIGLLLLALPVFYFEYTGVSWSPLVPHEHLIQNALAYFFLVLFSYFNHTVFVPRWFLTKQYQKYAIIAVSCVLAAAYLPYRIEQWAFFTPPLENTPLAWVRQLFTAEMMMKKPSLPPLTAHPHDHHGPPSMLFLPVKLTILFLLGSVSTLISVSVQTANRLRQVENDQLQAELRQLKAQIQPHFLFNTLNSIYALAIRNDERTAETIVKLSEFMRYIIRDAHRDKVPLAKEINYITNYIDLQKARLHDAVLVNYQLESDENSVEIAPLLLFSFVENAFKYGVSPDEESRVDIHLRIQEASLSLYVANKKVQLAQFEQSTGVGLQNARERLRLLYPDTHQLTIDNNPTDYCVYLRLTLA